MRGFLAGEDDETFHGEMRTLKLDFLPFGKVKCEAVAGALDIGGVGAGFSTLKEADDRYAVVLSADFEVDLGSVFRNGVVGMDELKAVDEVFAFDVGRDKSLGHVAELGGKHVFEAVDGDELFQLLDIFFLTHEHDGAFGAVFLAAKTPNKDAEDSDKEEGVFHGGNGKRKTENGKLFYGEFFGNSRIVN